MYREAKKVKAKKQTFSCVRKRELVEGLTLVKESRQGNAALSSCVLLGVCPCVLGAQNEVLLVKSVRAWMSSNCQS